MTRIFNIIIFAARRRWQVYKELVSSSTRLSPFLTLMALGILVLFTGCVPKDIVQWSSLNHFDSPSLRSDCSMTHDGGKPLPTGKVFAIQDIRCHVTKNVKPLPNPENMIIRVVEGPNCGGKLIYKATFSSVDGLRYSPNIPIVFGLGYLDYVVETPSVQLFRAQSNNTDRVSVSCTYTGTFEEKP